jgi:hypothetical protein
MFEARIDSGVIVPQSQSDRTALYEYKPLASSNSIRIAELLRGNVGGPIQVLLHHRTLLDLSTCAAVSYEWGSNIRQHEIHCEGKVIKVASNLSNLLGKLRVRDENQLLWIDAICVNQDDLDERSEQVGLMRDIYRNVVTVLCWIGDEHVYTREAFETIYQISEISASWASTLTIEDLNGVDKYKHSSEVPRGAELEALPEQPCWTGVIDVVTSRGYFCRTWVMQVSHLRLSRHSSFRPLKCSYFITTNVPYFISCHLETFWC